MNSGTVWFTVSLAPVKFQKSFLVFLHTGYCIYFWSHVAGFSGGVTIQRSDFTPAVSEISRFCFLSDFEKIEAVQSIDSYASSKEMLLNKLLKQF